MGGREKLPARRSAMIFEFDHVTPPGAVLHFVARVGLFPDGRVGEVFIDGEKLTSTADIEAHDAAIVLSIALQHGATLGEIGAALLREQSGRPHGVLGSMVDELTRHMRERGA